MTTRPIDAGVARRVTTIAAVIALILVVALPICHVAIGMQREAARLQSQADLIAYAVSRMVMRNPDLWVFESARLTALLGDNAHPRGLDVTQRVFGANGALLAEVADTIGWPSITVAAPVYDSGQVVGRVEVTASGQPVLWEASITAVVATLLGFAAFLGLRLLPLNLLRRALSHAAHLAAHDSLTGLPNRAVLREQLDRMLAAARRDGDERALLMIDLDRFKPVNDLHGHLAGDRLLQVVAERLRRCARDADSVARLGGDEFAVAARLTVDGAERMARRIVAAMEQPFPLDGVTARIGCSVGVAVVNRASVHMTDSTALIGQADAALYRAKAEGRGCFRFFEDGMDARLRERAVLEIELRLAIEEDRIEPHFQPLMDLATNRLIGFEMLARWTQPRRGPVSPTEFIPIAEDTGLIVPMTERLLRRGCREAATWPADLVLAANLSPVQLRDRSLPRMVRGVLAESGLPANRLELELTESALVGDLELAREIIGELKAIGVRLALDDFGTGYASLAHLQILPFDKLKIDASFIRSMGRDAGARKIVAAVVGLGQSLGLPTVAEGVERRDEADALRRLGCDVGQGWLFGKALCAADAARLAAGLQIESVEDRGVEGRGVEDRGVEDRGVEDRGVENRGVENRGQDGGLRPFPMQAAE